MNPTAFRRPTAFDIDGVAGEAFPLLITMDTLDGEGNPTVPWTDFSDPVVTVVDAYGVSLGTATVTSPQANQIQIEWGADDTTAIGAASVPSWGLSATVDGEVTGLMAGRIRMWPPTAPGPLGQTTVDVTVDLSDTAVQLTVIAGTGGDPSGSAAQAQANAEAFATAAVDAEAVLRAEADTSLQAAITALETTPWQANVAYPEGSIVTENAGLYQAPSGGAPSRATFTAGDWDHLSDLATPFGTTAGTAMQGNDSRVATLQSAAYQPTSAFDPAGAAGNAQSAAITAAAADATTKANAAQSAAAAASDPSGTAANAFAALLATSMQKSANGSDVGDPGSFRANTHVPVLTPVACMSLTTLLYAGIYAIDGITPNAGDLVLDASNAATAGLWAVAAGAWTRPTEFAAGSVIKGRTVYVMGGATFANQEWALFAPTAGITIGTTAQVWGMTFGGSFVQPQPGGTSKQPVYVPTISVRDFGARCDSRRVYGGAITSGSNVITLPAWAPSIRASDIGKPCGIVGAGILIGFTVGACSFTGGSTTTTVTSTNSFATAGAFIGQAVSGTGIPIGSTVASVSGTTITITSPSNTTTEASVVLTFGTFNAQLPTHNNTAPLIGFIGAGSSGSTINLVTTSGGSTPANAKLTVAATGTASPTTFGPNAPQPNGTVIWGTDDTAGIQATVYAAVALALLGQPISIEIPGYSVTTASISWGDSTGALPAWGVSLIGTGKGSSGIHVIGNPQAGAIQVSHGTHHQELCDFRDFELNGSLHTQAVYNVNCKGLAMDTAMHGRYTNLYVHDFPATGIACDANVDNIGFACESANNGRLNNGAQPGGSGFGHATGVFSPETSMWVNCIGRLNGGHGLFLENNSSDNTPTLSIGLVVQGGAYYLNGLVGVADAGAGSLMCSGAHLFSNAQAGGALFGQSFTESMLTGFNGGFFNNHIYANAKGFWYNPQLSGGSGSPLYNGKYIIQGNHIWANTSGGIRVETLTGSSPSRLTIQSNVVVDNGSVGIWLRYPSGATTIWNDVDILNNIVIGNGTNGTSLSDSGIAIDVNVTGLRIKGNTVTGNGAAGTGYGLAIGLNFTTAALSNVTVCDNDFTGSGANVQGGIHIGGSVTMTNAVFRNNPGSGYGGSTVPGTSFSAPGIGTTWTNNTGVDGTVYVTSAGGMTGAVVAGVTIAAALSSFRVQALSTFEPTGSGSNPTLVFVGDN